MTDPEITPGNSSRRPEQAQAAKETAPQGQAPSSTPAGANPAQNVSPSQQTAPAAAPGGASPSANPATPSPEQPQANPQAQTPYPSGPGFAPQQPYTAQVPPQPPYGMPYQAMPGQPNAAYGYAVPQKQGKKWPWIVLACVLAFLMGLGGCVGCATVNAVTDSLHGRVDGIHSRDFDDLPYGSDDPDNLPDSDTYGGFTLSDIRDSAGDLPNIVGDDDQASAGVYVVGRDIDAGRYFLAGKPSTESEFYLFEPEGSGTYSLKTAVTYTGNYFADLEDGEVIAFLPKLDDALMQPADQVDFSPKAPYDGGLYRVGDDIPAGTYNITVSPDAPKQASQPYAAYIMRDLDFGDNSIADSVEVMRGGTQTITVEEGDWLELFGATATPMQR